MALGYAFFSALTPELVKRVSATISVFHNQPAPDCPAFRPRQPPTPRKARDSGASAPENIRAKPKKITAPKPAIQMEAKQNAPPISADGNAARAGAADRAGPGTGAGGQGDGLGSGPGGAGSGSGGGSRPQLLSGEIRDRDYPKAARKARAEGIVIAHFTVGPNGRPSGCVVKRSSGNEELDATTCRLIEARFRYQPARNSKGEPVSEVMGWQQSWWLEPR
ncbi:MAG: TonB family protein [Parasphingorhabdus sp.]|nr:TonB family protein [Parasphingorhabdus sp.]